MEQQHGMSIPVLYAVGTHYEIGYQVGVTFEKRIKEYFSEFDDLRTKFIPFSMTEQGKKICEGYLNVVRKEFPQYVEELRGISDGSGISFDELFLMHIRVELQTYLETEIVPECTTVLVNNKQHWLLAHNEDTSYAAYNRGYILIARILEPYNLCSCLTDKENILAFCYPGIIPGNCFSCNKHGLALSVNALYPKNFQTGQTPRQFLNRAMLAAENPIQLHDILKNKGYGIATGCSVNMAYQPELSKGTMANYELCPQSNVAETLIDKIDVLPHDELGSKREYAGHYIHYNMYQHMNVQQMEGRTTSSEHRKTRADTLPPPFDMDSALTILGDHEDDKYPIYRIPRPTDPGSTIVTGVFDLLHRKVIVYMGNPLTNRYPVIDLSFPWEIRA